MAYDGSIKIDTSIDGKGYQSGLTKLAKGASVSLAALGTAVVALGKQAISAYAEYEQLVGGVDTLFKKSSGTVQKYAANAYKTAGLSANEYMEQATSFSASLLQSLGNDTRKAARVTDMAITDMSDNANKMGTDMERIQDAYQGFAKQNYTMLDNLKLGYGGTKGEMERLLADAEKFSGVKYDIGNLNDVFQAIHVIQGELEITGTTALEASTTIQGSAAMMKSAWANLLVGMADDTLDFDKLLSNLIDSVGTFADNLLPRIEIALNGVVKLIEGLSPKIAEIVPRLISDLLPKIVDISIKIIKALVDGLISNLPEIVRAGKRIVTALLDGIGDMVPALKPITNIVKEVAKTVGNALELISKNLKIVTPIATTFIALWAVNKFASFVTNAGGIVKILDKMKTSLNGATIAKVKDSIETAKINALYAKEVVQKIASTVATTAHTIAQKAANGTLADEAKKLNENLAAKIKNTVQTIATTAAEKAKAIAQGVSNTATNAGTIAETAHAVASKAAAVATGLFSAALKLLLGPVGLVIAGVAALAVGITALIGWLNKESDAYKDNKDELEDLSKSQEDYEQTLKDTEKAHDTAIAGAEAQEKTSRDLLGTIKKLSSQENKTAEDKKKLSLYVERLNESQEGLNITYDEATDTLSSTTDEIDSMITANAKLAKEDALNDYADGLTKNLVEVETQLLAVENAQKRYKEQLENGDISQREYNKLMKESGGIAEEYAVKKQEVTDRLNAATEQQLQAEREAAAERERIAEQEKANLQAVADKWGVSVETIQQEMADEEQSLGEWEAAHGAAVQEIADKWDVSTEQIQSAMRNTGISIEEYDKKFEEMVDRQKETFKDYTAAATNVFSQIKDESETTIDDMIENLNHNANAMSQWSDNIAILAKRGIRDGLLQQMVDAGPQAASALQSLVNASDEKLNELNLAFDEAGNSTVKAYNKWYEVDPQNAASLRMLYGEAGAVKSNTSVPDALKENAEKGVKSAQKGMNKESGKKTAENFTDGVASEIAHDKSVDTAMRGIGKSAEKAFESAISTLPQKTNSAMTQVAATIKSGMQTAANTTKSSVKGITSVFDSMKSRVTASASQLGSQVSSALKTGMNSASGSVKSIVNNIVNDFNSAKSRVTASVRSMMSGAQTAVNSGGANLRKSASSAANNIVSGFRSAQYQMSNIGYNMMSGVNSAMWSMAGTLYSTARTIANNVAATMRRALQIHSPSRVMQEIFHFFMQGGEVGMHDKEKDLYGTAEGIANKVSASIVPDVDLSGMLAKARAAISAEQSRMSANFAANAEYKTTVIAAQQEVQESTPMVETHINIDSREFAVATTPAIMKQAGWSPA